MISFIQYLLKSNKEKCLKDYFGESFVIDDWSRDYILENLNTHDQNLLIKKLEKIKYFNKVEFEQKQVIKLVCNKKADEQELNNVLDFYGYYISLKQYDLETDRYFYFICPKYSKNYTDFIFDQCKGVCYHICQTKDVESILKNGLRCRSAKYRYFPKRIYVIALPVKEISKLNTTLKSIVEEIGIDNTSKYSVLRIDLGSNGNSHGSGPDFYQDDAMENENTFFTYTNIPPQYIKDQGQLNKFIYNIK